MERDLSKKLNNIKPLDKMVLSWEEYRFTVLTSSMIRMEYSSDKKFEDRATKLVTNRCFPSVFFEFKETKRSLEIITEKVRLSFLKEKGGFTSSNLSVEVIGNYSTYHSSWNYGQEFETLKGTARTLDFADGSVSLEEGLMNRNGYALIDDSETVLINEDGWIKPKERKHIDLYFLGYGRDYLQTLKDYFHLTGYPPLIPRYALGNWWSRFYPYSEQTYKELMYRFDEENIPFSVAVLDMDWHMIDIPAEYGSGWTGYTWNRDLFPEPVRFLNWLHDLGVQISLNLHPAHGIQPHEDAYENMASELGLDSSKKQGIEFDVTDSKFMDAYFTYLHHPHEEDGVDFWWIDWQQGNISKMDGVDPLWMLNHYHYLDHGRDGKRPLIFSRYAGLGSHRYPLGFSGDTITTWDSLDFQPYFTSTASNVGYTWWSHDIGGHMRGTKDKELYVRWLQYGTFSPINRLHSTGGKYNGKEPWRYGFESEKVVKEFLRLRHQLIPYLYSMNVLTHQDGLPLVRPLYYHHPWNEEAYSIKNQYYFGTELLAAPITSKIDPIVQRAHVKTWLPKGTWFDFFSGTRYRGDRLMDVYRPLNTIPIFAKAGAIIPKNAVIENKTENPKSIELIVFAGADGYFTLYEDSGKSPIFDGATTSMELNWHSNNLKQAVLTIHRPKGNTARLPNERQFSVHLIGVALSEDPAIQINGKIQALNTERTSKGVYIKIPKLPLNTEYTITFNEINLKSNNVKKQIEELLDAAQIEFDLKEEIDQVIFEENNENVIIGKLLALDLEDVLIKALSEILLADPA